MIWALLFIDVFIILSPLFLLLFYGAHTICDASTHAECFRNWFAAMAGPVAVLAAIIAVLPVYAQLDEGKRSTQAAIAGLFKYEEDEKGGEMSALREENDRVTKDTRDIIYFVSSLSNGDKKLILTDYLTLYKFRNSTKDLSQYLFSKKDIKSILPARLKLAGSLLECNKILSQSGSYFLNPTNASSAVRNLSDGAQNLQTDLEEYQSEYRTLDARLGAEQDAYRSKREKIMTYLSEE